MALPCPGGAGSTGVLSSLRPFPSLTRRGGGSSSSGGGGSSGSSFRGLYLNGYAARLACGPLALLYEGQDGLAALILPPACSRGRGGGVLDLGDRCEGGGASMTLNAVRMRGEAGEGEGEEEGEQGGAGSKQGKAGRQAGRQVGRYRYSHLPTCTAAAAAAALTCTAPSPSSSPSAPRPGR